ncbi:metallophosphoesterase [Xanthocytophaga agilis]|uniref:Metallophosphoesterase n=1 Tax=Xanthocytophaga agilis TaxID=3048010 RepID=A0AAE3R2Y3_9BACT|nr:metallophosphoesterase [Xanthocytophaga agilis]MDJ1500674.1 metallophosphoesterase [Xanthocytophaga agilis]
MIRFLHLSDLHFSQLIENPTYSIQQLIAIEKFYKSETFDRVIVTGDLTNDAKIDSFIKAREWLNGSITLSGGNKTGLNIDNDIQLKVVPGNRDYIHNKTSLKKGEDIYFEGLNTYNKEFAGNHLFSKRKPLVYDWFDLSETENVGVFILYVNTSILGEDDSNNKLKANYLHYISVQINNLIKKGRAGTLIKSVKSGAFISSVEFRKSFKFLVAHHPFQNEEKIYDFISNNKKKEFLSNLAMMDFNIQLSGHRHIYEKTENTYTYFFDKRAVDRYLINELLLQIGEDKLIDITSIKKGKKISKPLRIIITIIKTLLIQDDSIHNVISKMDKIVKGTPQESLNYLIDAIKTGTKREQEDNYNEILNYLNNLTKNERKLFADNAQKIVSKILNELKQRSLQTFNAGSCSLPYINGEKTDRHFNTYSFEYYEGDFTLCIIDYIWNPDIGDFELNERCFITYSLDKLKINEIYQNDQLFKKKSQANNHKKSQCILMLTADVVDQTKQKLNLEREHSQIIEMLQDKKDIFDVIIRRNINKHNFIRYIKDRSPDILHFSGHGEMTDEDLLKLGIETGGIWMLNEEKNGFSCLKNDELDSIFDNFQRSNIPLRVVIFNACYSYEPAKRASQYGPIAIGISARIPNDSAISFSKGFYTHLSKPGFECDFINAYKEGVLYMPHKHKEMIKLYQGGNIVN